MNEYICMWCGTVNDVKVVHCSKCDKSTSNSWVIVDKETGEGKLEFFNPDLIDKVNIEKYEVLTSYEHLCRMNKRIRETGKQHLTNQY